VAVLDHRRQAFKKLLNTAPKTLDFMQQFSYDQAIKIALVFWTAHG
jgi:hypothetical protein